MLPCRSLLTVKFSLLCQIVVFLFTPLVLANEPASQQPSDELLEIFTQRPESIYGAKATYRVYRNKKPVGSHTLRFSHQTNELTVEVESRLAVKILGITLYRYRYSAVEVWSGGELVNISTEIRNNKKPKVDIVASSQGSYWRIDARGKSQSTSSPEYGTNHWHPGAIQAKRLYHPLHGKVYRSAPQSFGWERVVKEDGVAISARKFRYSHGFDADVWYDKDWRWVRLEFRADDGSRIVYNCDVCTAGE